MVTRPIRPVASCTECGLESAGRCPTCHRTLCMDHFGRGEHQPCADRLSAHADKYVCYVCGVPVRPQQWSTSVFLHYVDSSVCQGCGRYICDQRHTAVQDESVRIERDSLRSHRYHMTARYCSVCAPLRRMGGLIGAARWSTLAVTLAGAAYFAVQALR